MKCIAIDQKSNLEWYKSWRTLSPKLEDRVFDDNELICKALNDNTDEKFFLVAHDSKFQGQKKITELIAKLNIEGLRCFLMYVDGSGLSEQSESCWLHYSRTPVGSGVGLSHLSKKFELLCKNLESAKTEENVKSAWHEFDRNSFPETLTAAYLLMVAQEKGISVPLKSLSDEQWKEACEQYRGLGGDKNANWDGISECEANEIGKVKERIGKLLSPVASQT